MTSAPALISVAMCNFGFEASEKFKMPFYCDFVILVGHEKDL